MGKSAGSRRSTVRNDFLWEWSIASAWFTLAQGKKIDSGPFCAVVFLGAGENVPVPAALRCGRPLCGVEAQNTFGLCTMLHSDCQRRRAKKLDGEYCFAHWIGATSDTRPPVALARPGMSRRASVRTPLLAAGRKSRQRTLVAPDTTPLHCTSVGLRLHTRACGPHPAQLNSHFLAERRAHAPS